MEIKKLNITITKTADGAREYIQILSEEQISINVVFVARSIDLKDHRDETEEEKEKD